MFQQLTAKTTLVRDTRAITMATILSDRRATRFSGKNLIFRSDIMDSEGSDALKRERCFVEFMSTQWPHEKTHIHPSFLCCPWAGFSFIFPDLHFRIASRYLFATKYTLGLFYLIINQLKTTKTPRGKSYTTKSDWCWNSPLFSAGTGHEWWQCKKPSKVRTFFK